MITNPPPEKDLKGYRSIDLMSPNYANTIVYKIKCRDTSVPDFYLGYATNSLVTVSRLFQTRCKHDMKWRVCEFVRTHGGFENWVFEQLPSKPCSSALEARIELRKHFNADPPTLNVQLPTRTNKEYAQGDKNRANHKLYREGHLDKIHRDQAIHYQKNKERLLTKRREYQSLNKDKINENAKVLRVRKKEMLEAAQAAAATASTS